MKKNEVQVGGTYLAKVTDKVVSVRLDAENSHGGWDATNLSTNKKVRIKSAQRLRGPAKGGEKKTEDKPAVQHDPDLVPLSQLDKEKKAAKREGKLSCLGAAVQVLKAKGEPMTTGAMIEAMRQKKLWDTKAPTPAATLYSAILREITTKKAEARFKKTDRGLFALQGK